MKEPVRLLADDSIEPELREALRAETTRELPFDVGGGLDRLQAAIDAGRACCWRSDGRRAQALAARGRWRGDRRGGTGRLEPLSPAHRAPGPARAACSAHRDNYEITASNAAENSRSAARTVHRADCQARAAARTHHERCA
jgi:hypothetical protein